MKNPGRSLEKVAQIASTALSKYHKAVFLINPDVMKIYHAGRGLYVG